MPLSHKIHCFWPKKHFFFLQLGLVLLFHTIITKQNQALCIDISDFEGLNISQMDVYWVCTAISFSLDFNPIWTKQGTIFIFNENLLEKKFFVWKKQGRNCISRKERFSMWVIKSCHHHHHYHHHRHHHLQKTTTISYRWSLARTCSSH